MNTASGKPTASAHNRSGWWLLLAAIILTLAIYSSGLSGSYLFDDYPNIVDNAGVQPHDASVSSLVGAALSSPSSEFKRPLASLSFAANFLITGLDPYWMKLTNLVIHLLNGLLMFLLSRALLQAVSAKAVSIETVSTEKMDPATASGRAGIIAALIATGWMLLPINLTAVLYVVQRMESLANLFVLLGLFGYVSGRSRMLGNAPSHRSMRKRWLEWTGLSRDTRSFMLCLVSITAPAAFGILAKETAVMLPLYALLIEWIVFGFCKPDEASTITDKARARFRRHDYRIIGMFMLVLVVPMIVGLAWLLPGLLNPEVWATRDFTMETRLLSEARIVIDYIIWTLLPTPGALSFYHDDFRISTGLLAPWTTLASMVALAALVALLLWLRQRRPLAALGAALFLGCQLLTGTIIPLELIYEHRNYFASFGLLLAIVPLLAAPRLSFFALPRHALLAGLMLFWMALTALTAYAWGNPLQLAEDLASRAQQSPRAQYELGRTYIIYSHYDPASPFVGLAYAPLEKAAALPNASILPEQALIFMNARMKLPLKDAWWDSMIAKLKTHQPGVQDESSLGSLTQCVREHQCALPQDRMIESFIAALAHPNPSARLLATYGDYAWNVMNDRALGERMIAKSVEAGPNEPAYQITLIRMLLAQGRDAEAKVVFKQLKALNIGGRLNDSLAELRTSPGLQ